MRTHIERNKDADLDILIWAYAHNEELLVGPVSVYMHDYIYLIMESGVVEVGKFESSIMLAYSLYGRLLIKNKEHSGILHYDDNILDKESNKLMRKLSSIGLAITLQEEMAFFGDLIRAFPEEKLFLSGNSNGRYDTNDITDIYNRFLHGK